MTDDAIRRVLRTTPESTGPAYIGTHGAVASGMQSVAFTPATAVAALFTATAADIGMVGTTRRRSGRTAGRGRGERVDRLPGPGGGESWEEGGQRFPTRARGLSLLGCAGPGKVYRFAQIVAAATLALEISASAAMATAG